MLVECVKDQSDRDNKLHVLKRSAEKGHTQIEMNDFEIIGQNYKNNKWKRKVFEAL